MHCSSLVGGGDILLPNEKETDDVMIIEDRTSQDIICTVEGCGKTAKIRVLPVTFQRVMLCDEHFARLGGKF